MDRRHRRAVIFHRFSALVWALLAVPAVLFWQQSILFVIAASIYANVKSDVGAANAADDRAVLEQLAEINRKLDRLTGARACPLCNPLPRTPDAA